MGNLFNLILFEPMFNGVVFIYRYIPDMGAAIIILTIVIRSLLYIPSRSSIRSQKTLQDTQPKLKEIQEKYKNNKEELGKQLMKFYKDNKVNPLSSCLPLLIQLPILIALYRAFLAVSQTDPSTHILVAGQLQHLYGWLQGLFATTAINPISFGFIDISKNHNIVLAVLAGAAQFWQSRMLMAKQPPKVPGAKDESIAAGVNKQMMYMMPLMTILFGYQFPAGLTIYWLFSTLFSVAQQYYVFKKDKPKVLQAHEPQEKGSA